MTKSIELNRYIGRIKQPPAGESGVALIDINSVTKEDGSPHDIKIKQDIVLLGESDWLPEFRVGMEVSFHIFKWQQHGRYRAINVFKYTGDALLIPVGEQPIPGFNIVIPPMRPKAELALCERLPVHVGMKAVPEKTLSQVIANAPMPRIPRTNDIPSSDEEKQELLKRFLAMLFPSMVAWGADYRVLHYDDKEFDQMIKNITSDYYAIGVQENIVTAEVEKFKKTRSALALMFKENIVRRDTIIPIQYLPDLFMAVPVWYFWVNNNIQKKIDHDWQINEPRPDDIIKYFCNLFLNQQWFDTFQLFNRRVRTLKQYDGEIIPPRVARRIRQAVELFDFIVIATPYHDQAGKEWDNPEWIRPIDPYVLGFKKGIPFFFVLARYTDAGTFPLFNELVADTIEFLKAKKDGFRKFNDVDTPYWYSVRDGNISDFLATASFGKYITSHILKILSSFNEENLFDWLRNDTPEKA